MANARVSHATICQQLKAAITTDGWGEFIFAGSTAVLSNMMQQMLDNPNYKSEEWGDYANPSAAIKTLAATNLAFAFFIIGGNLKNAKNVTDGVKNALIGTGALAVAAYGGVWGATGKKLRTVCQFASPMLNFITQRTAKLATLPEGQTVPAANAGDGDVPLMYQNIHPQQLEEGKAVPQNPAEPPRYGR